MSNFETLVKEIAVELTMLGNMFDNPVWSAEIDGPDTYRPMASLQANDGRRIRLWADSNHIDNGARLEISGSWPHARTKDNYFPISYHDNPPVITVAMKRGGQAIAKDIASRFLPEFNEMWKTAVERVEAHENAERNREAARDKICAAWRTAHKSGHSDREIYIGDSSTEHGGKIDVYTAEAIYLELRRIPLDKLIQIAAILEPKVDGEAG